jgi:hypothetical protein
MRDRADALMDAMYVVHRTVPAPVLYRSDDAIYRPSSELTVVHDAREFY